MSKERVTCEMLSSGQREPYGDSIYTGILTIEWQGMDGYKNKDAPFVPRDEGPDKKKKSPYDDTYITNIVKPLVKAMIRFYEDKPAHYWAPYLRELEHVGPGIWKATIVERWTD